MVQHLDQPILILAGEVARLGAKRVLKPYSFCTASPKGLQYLEQTMCDRKAHGLAPSFYGNRIGALPGLAVGAVKTELEMPGNCQNANFEGVEIQIMQETMVRTVLLRVGSHSTGLSIQGGATPQAALDKLIVSGRAQKSGLVSENLQKKSEYGKRIL